MAFDGQKGAVAGKFEMGRTIVPSSINMAMHDVCILVPGDFAGVLAMIVPTVGLGSGKVRSISGAAAGVVERFGMR